MGTTPPPLRKHKSAVLTLQKPVWWDTEEENKTSICLAESSQTPSQSRYRYANLPDRFLAKYMYVDITKKLFYFSRFAAQPAIGRSLCQYRLLS
jgi:hypothetical protein